MAICLVVIIQRSSTLLPLELFAVDCPVTSKDQVRTRDGRRGEKAWPTCRIGSDEENSLAVGRTLAEIRERRQDQVSIFLPVVTPPDFSAISFCLFFLLSATYEHQSQMHYSPDDLQTAGPGITHSVLLEVGSS